MTLKISRFLTDAFNKQAKISHFDYKLSVGSPNSMKAEWKQKLLDQFGELFLSDANYVIMTKVKDADDKLKKKFSDLIAAVLDTEVPSSDVKSLDLEGAEHDDGDDEDDDGESSAPSSESVLLVKLTTK